MYSVTTILPIWFSLRRRSHLVVDPAWRHFSSASRINVCCGALTSAQLDGIPSLRGTGRYLTSHAECRRFARLHQRRRVLVRDERRANIHEAFLSLAGCLICWRRPAGWAELREHGAGMRRLLIRRAEPHDAERAAPEVASFVV
jgi:hypothetical protein